jgi:hypothetical protein
LLQELSGAQREVAIRIADHVAVAFEAAVIAAHQVERIHEIGEREDALQLVIAVGSSPEYV